MKMNEITEIEVDTLEAGPSQGWKPYCKNTPREKMSASWLSSCKSRGHVTRVTKKTQKTQSGRKKHAGLGPSEMYGGWRGTGKGSTAG
tara:strand:- start:559 stop:822 length:264 start_codon:yes stop_codon:yes gene_type:complete